MITGRIIRQTEIGNRLPEIGKIKCGFKDDKGYPKSIDYFISYGKYKAYFDTVYDKPNVIQIVFYTDNIGECCNERFELRDSKGKLYGRGNGQLFEIWNNKTKLYDIYEMPKDELLIKQAGKDCGSSKGWERVLTIRFLIPKIRGVYGAWALETKADKSSIDQIVKTFDTVLNKAGTVTKIVFDLTVKKQKSQKPNDPSSYPVLNIVPNVSEGNLAIVKAFIEHNRETVMITDEILDRAQIEAAPKDKKKKEEQVQLPWDES